MHTQGFWKQRTSVYEPKNISFSCIAVYTIKSVGGNSRKFDAKVTQIHGQSYRGAMAALTQVTNLQKAEDVANLKM